MAEPRNRRPWIWIVIVLLILGAAWWLYAIAGAPAPKDSGLEEAGVENSAQR